jgi:hypothetical protein
LTRTALAPGARIFSTIPSAFAGLGTGAGFAGKAAMTARMAAASVVMVGRE